MTTKQAKQTPEFEVEDDEVTRVRRNYSTRSLIRYI
jgi:hypothetical protein